jgi:phospholipid/cholesterol/gamma-HCH transport system ATP-binding protein
MIEFAGVSAGPLAGVSFAVPAGTTAGLVTSSEAVTDRVLRLLVGAERAAAGTVRVFGRPVADLPEAEALELLARLGVAWPDGGLVSNLKAWENILLPLWYHGDRDAGAREGEALELLGSLGVPAERAPGLLQASPGRLDVRERRIVGLVREFLRDPETLVLAGQLEGLDAGTRERFRETARRRHGGGAARTTLWVVSDERDLAGAGASLLVRLGNDGRVAA